MRKPFNVLDIARMCRKEAQIPIIRVCLDSQAVLPAVQGCFTKPGHLGKFRPCHTQPLSDMPNFVWGQDAKMPAYRPVSQSFSLIIKIFEITGFASAHRNIHCQFYRGFSGPVTVYVRLP